MLRTIVCLSLVLVITMLTRSTLAEIVSREEPRDPEVPWEILDKQVEVEKATITQSDQQ